MTDYLARFQASTRRKADPELIQRWEWDARFHGDRNIKIQATSAKRTATSMQKVCDQFSNIKPEHELAIKAAASALRSMAHELTQLAAWANDYHAFCAAEWKKRDADELEAFAQARWGNDDQAVQFEFDLIAELGSRDGRQAFAAWCHGAGKHVDCSVENISCDIPLRPGPSMRARAALSVREGQENRRTANKWSGIHGPTVICSWADYDAYLVFRKEVAKSSEKIVRMVGSSTRP